MSTRSSKYYANHIHLFREQNYNVICMDIGHGYLDVPEKHKDNEYGSFTMSLESWKDFHKAIGEAIKEAECECE